MRALAAAYVEKLLRHDYRNQPSSNTAIRMLFDLVVTSGVLTVNLASVMSGSLLRRPSERGYHLGVFSLMRSSDFHAGLRLTRFSTFKRWRAPRIGIRSLLLLLAWL